MEIRCRIHIIDTATQQQNKNNKHSFKLMTLFNITDIKMKVST